MYGAQYPPLSAPSRYSLRALTCGLLVHALLLCLCASGMQALGEHGAGSGAHSSLHPACGYCRDMHSSSIAISPSSRKLHKKQSKFDEYNRKTQGKEEHSHRRGFRPCSVVVLGLTARAHCWLALFDFSFWLCACAHLAISGVWESLLQTSKA